VSDSEKPPVAASTAAPAKRSRTVGALAIVAGMAAAVVGLINVLAGNTDLVDILLLVGGLLVSVLGLRIIRRARTS
jgi:hypothetical protein